MTDDWGTKVVRSGRLVWLKDDPDEAYWQNHWESHVTPAYYDSATSEDLSNDELGRIVLSTFSCEGRLVEAGCGAGWYVAALRDAGFDVDGIEFSGGLVERINRVMPDLPVRWGDALDLSAPDGSYDSYLSIGVIEHLESGPEPFIAEAFRLLSPGGRAVIAVPSFGPIRRFKAMAKLYGRGDVDLPFFQYGFECDHLRDLMIRSGFSVDATTYYGVHRLLFEEVPFYRWAFLRRGGERIVRNCAERILRARDGRMRDGHMAVVVATKPA